MPGGSIKPVEQRFGADASAYIAEVQKIIAANREIVSSVAEVKRALGEVAALRGGTGGTGSGGQDVAAEFRRQMDAARSYGQALGEAKAAAGGFTVAQAAGLAVARDHAAAMATAAEAQRQVSAVTGAGTGTVAAHAEQVRAATEAYSGQASAARELNDAVAALGAASREHATGLRYEETALAAFLGDATVAVDRTSALSDAIRQAGRDARGYSGDLGTVRDAARSASAATSDLAANVIAASAATGGGGGLGSSLTDAGRSLDQIALNAGFASYRDLMSASLGAGGGAALAARSFYGSGPMSPPPGSGGGYTGGLWPAAASGGGGGGGGLLTAGGYADAITAWAGRVAPAVHYVTMAIAELAATVVPAAVALGAAGFVGLQGGQQMYTRIAAINAVEQSLGGAYGQTTGTFLGLQPKLQQLQDYAQGGTYEIAGAGINLLKSGFGGAFGGEGVQTIAMIDRGIADMQSNLQAKGTGAELGSLLGQGPDYLRQFGDIASNLGNLVLGVAPHLPGVGDDWISTLEGLTGGLSAGVGFLNTHHAGDVIGGLMAGEAGWRLGTPLVGLAGRGITGLGGLAARAGLGALPLGEGEIASLAASTGVDASLIDAGGSGLAGLLGGAGAGLGALTGPAVAGLAISAFLGSKLISSMPSPAQRQVSAMQSQIGREGYTAALGMQAPAGFQAQGWLPLGKAITETTGLAGAVSPYASMSTLMGTSQTAEEYGRFGPQGETTRQVYQNAATGFSRQMSDLITSGPQLKAALDKMGLKGTSLADAFQIAQNSLLDLSHAFGPDGRLNKQAMTMVGNYVSALEPMTQNAGALGAAIGAQTIMSQGSVKQLQQVNQSMDSMTSIMEGGATGIGGFTSQVRQVRAGFTTPSGKPDTTAESNAAMAKALTSFTSAGGAAAWNAFASTSTSAPGLITTMEQNLDQYRTALTLGALTPGQAAGLTGYQLKQALPMGRQSPAALAMIMQQMAQAGIGTNLPGGGYYDQGESLAKNYQQAREAISGVADSTRQANATTGSMVVKMSNIPAIAKEFSTTVGTTVQSQEAAKAASDLIAIQKSALGGGINQGALKDWVSTLKGAGVEGGGAIRQTLDAQLRQMGVSQAMTVKINAEVGKVTIPKPPKLPSQTYDITPKVHPPVIPPAAPQTYEVIPHVRMPVIPHIPNQSFDIIGHIFTVGGGGVATSTMVGSGGGMRLTGQHGFRVPGYGGGDTHPAWLEGGEAVVPKHLVPAIAPFLAANKVPGFQSGGIAGGVTLGEFVQDLSDTEKTLLEAISGLSSAVGGISSQVSTYQDAGYGRLGQAASPASAPKGTASDPVAVELAGGSLGAFGGGSAGIPAGGLGALPIPVSAQKVIDAFDKTFAGMGNPWGKFASQIMQGLLDGIKNAPKETADMAKALTAKVTQEVNFARSVSSASVSGLNFAGMSNLPTPTMTAGGQPYQYYADQASGNPLSVQQQMGDYLQAIQSFQGDESKLAKGGLNKTLLKQLLGAGPLQGDQEAQSILGGAGGVGAVNKLWKQINSASNQLGIQGAESVYGYGGAGAGKSVRVGVHADAAAAQSAIDAIHGKSVVISVKLDLTTSGGGSSSGGGLDLSAAQIKQVTAAVQAQLLKQAKRNRKTGLQLPGYGS